MEPKVDLGFIAYLAHILNHDGIGQEKDQTAITHIRVKNGEGIEVVETE